ncbi:MAG: hydrogenase expression/formation protein HypE [Anaerolineae bacterium]|jgi:hydrogenase expression/formation protein HypE
MNEHVQLGHGSGGALSRQLVRDIFLRYLDDAELSRLGDSAVLPAGVLCGAGESLAFTTDSYVVSPLEFPGGDIGRLAVCGTVNDLAAAGAEPLWISAAWILEEGLPMATLERLVGSMAEAAREAGVRVVTGDTKVVPRGLADGAYVNTAGVGRVPANRRLGRDRVRAGDVVLVSGYLGDHGMAVMLRRQGISMAADLASDVAPLHGLVGALFDAGVEVHWLRDATRGGLGSVLCELAEGSPFGVEIEEARLPVRPEVAGAAELLGLDPLFIANEGKMVAVVAGSDADQALEIWRAHPLGRDAALVGQVTDGRPGRVTCRTPYGTSRLIRLPAGELLPRIC